MTDLNSRRKSKHHELIQSILKELRGLEAVAALEIRCRKPEESANLRPAAHRASISAGIVIGNPLRRVALLYLEEANRDV